MKTKFKAFTVILIPIAVFVIANLVGYKNLDTLVLAKRLILSEQIKKNLDSSDRYLAISSLSILADRGNAGGLETAADWLSDEHDWLHGALYLADFQKEIAIPHLIRGLDHPYASGLYPEIHEKLVALTSEDFGTEKPSWVEWWRESNPEISFNFSTENLALRNQKD